MIRSFIAIGLDSGIKAELEASICKLKGSGADVKWVRCENIHLTLKFLGNISPDTVEDVKKILDNAGMRFAPFKMTLSGVGAFPGLSHPRVIWVGIGEGADEAKKIYAFLEEGLEKLRFEREERPFSPHLTIGRVRSSGKKEALASAVEGLKLRPDISQRVESITFFQSTLTPKGPIYTPLHKARLSV